MVETPQGRSAELKRATVLFVDIAGFTVTSEKLGAERAYFIVTGCLKLLDAIAREHGAAVDKYLGDCLMAVFGYPLPLDDSAARALLAALEMRRRVSEYNRELELEIPLDIRVGVNTGLMVASDVRGSVIREFHVLGDVVNVAARLKARAAVGQIYVGHETIGECEHRFRFRPLEDMKLKGKRAAVRTFELLAPRASVEAVRGSWNEAIWSEMVGREKEIERLRGALFATRPDAGAVVCVVGEEGIGKTRLLREALCDQQLGQASLLHARAASLYSERDLHLFGSLIRDWAGLQLGDDDPTSLERLRHAFQSQLPSGRERALSEIAELVGIGSSRQPPAAGPSKRDSAAGASRSILHLIEGMADVGPRVLVFEDLQWIDPASHDLLLEAIALAEHRPILFVLSMRPAPGSAAHELFEQVEKRWAGRHARIDLAPLDEQSASRLLTSLAGEPGLPAPIRETIQQRAGGNPGRLVRGALLAPALSAETGPAAAGQQRWSEGERRRATIVFADITGFTAMMEQLGAQRAYPIVVGCLEVLEEVAHRYGGTVDKVLGDCVMALFGVPDAIEDAPRAAVNAAIEMRERVREFSRERGLGSRLDIHTGINTGLGISGDISGPLIREFAVMGDPVDVASRLSDLAPAGRIFVGPETHRLTEDVFEYRARTPIPLPGGKQHIPTFELESTEKRLHRRRIGAERQVFSELVGRDGELAILRAAVARVAAGEGGIVSLIAEAGIGKSRLLAELRAAPEAEAVDWREGRSLSTCVRLSLYPFADLCRSWAGIEDRDEDEAACRKLEELLSRVIDEEAHDVFPLLATILGLRLDAAAQERLRQVPADAKEKMIRRALTLLLRRGSDDRPILVVMEDLHWADVTSIELLESLLRLAADHAVLFVNVFRPGFGGTSERVRDIARQQHGERHTEIALAPLPRDATRRLILNLFRGGDLPHATRDLIEERARGNPFYIEEVVRSLVDDGAVIFREGTFCATDKIHSAVIPGTIQEVIMARVDALPAGRKRTLRAAAVIGRSFHRDVLASIVNDGAGLEEDLRALQDAEFLVPWDQFRGREYAFKHPLIQEVTYDAILEAQRSELHLQVARAIEERLSTDVPGFFGMLAYHFNVGADAERAEMYLFRAGDEAAKVAASSEALHFFEEASKLYFEQHGKEGDRAKMATLQRKIADALFLRGRLTEAVESIDRTLELLGRKVPQRPLELASRFVGNLLSVLLRLYAPSLTRSRPEATDAEREIIGLMFERCQAQTTASPTRYLFDFVSTLANLDRVDPATVPGSGGIYAGGIGLFSFGGISFGISRRFLERGSRLVDPHDPRERFVFRLMSFLHHYLEGDWSEEHEIEASEVAENLRLGELWAVTTYLGLLGEKRIHTGDFAGAREAMGQIDEIWDLYQYDLAKTNHYALPTYLALQRRELDEALGAADRYYDENPEDLLHILALSSKAKALMLCERLEEAEDCLERSARLVALSKTVPPFHLSCYRRSRLLLDLALLERDLHTPAGRSRSLRLRAAASVRAALRVAGKVAWQRPEVFRLAGRFQWLVGSPTRARSFWEQSMEEGRRLGARPELARTYAEVGLLLASERGGSGRLAGCDGEAYTEKAAVAFEALGLREDLAALERVRAVVSCS